MKLGTAAGAINVPRGLDGGDRAAIEEHAHRIQIQPMHVGGDSEGPIPRLRLRWDAPISVSGCVHIARQLPYRSLASVAARACKLGLATYARRWSTQDDRRLAQLTARGPRWRTSHNGWAVPRRRSAGVPRGSEPSPCTRARDATRRARHWTGEEDELLRLLLLPRPASRSVGAGCHRGSSAPVRVTEARPAAGRRDQPPAARGPRLRWRAQSGR